MNGRRPFSLHLRSKTTADHSPERSPERSRTLSGHKADVARRHHDATRRAETFDVLSQLPEDKEEPEASTSRAAFVADDEADNIGWSRDVRRASYASSTASSDVSGQVRATENWFGSPATDEESSEPESPSDEEWPHMMMSDAREVLLLQEKAIRDEEAAELSRALKQSQLDAEEKLRISPSRQVAGLPTPNGAPRSATLKTRPANAGILRRLRRIKKKEKTASTMSYNDFAQEEIKAASPERVNEAAVTAQASGVALATPAPLNLRPQASDSTLTPERNEPKSAFGDETAPLKDARATERTPLINVKRQSSIHSIEASLVDTESETDDISLREDPQSFADELRELDSRDDMEQWNGSSVSMTSTADYGMIESHLQADDATWSMRRIVNSPGQPKLSPVPAQEKASPSSHREVTSRRKNRPTSLLSDTRTNGSSVYTDASQGLSPMRPYADGEDDATTPRASEQPDRQSYFDAPASPMPSKGKPQRQSAIALQTPSADWLEDVRLSRKQRHALVEFLISQEISWESERLFLLNSLRDLGQPWPSHRQPRFDITYLKPTTGKIKPDLPLAQFLYQQVVQTCPLFGTAHRMTGAGAQRARMEGAKEFLERGVLPFAKFVHARSLRHVFTGADALLGGGTNSSMAGAALHKLVLSPLSRYLTAIADTRSKPLRWTDVPIPSEASFLSHRVSPSKLRQGGFEVNVVGARLKPGQGESGCELLLMVRRFGFPATYTLRSEDDFYTYARVLAEKLGPASRIRPVPLPTGGDTREETNDLMSPLEAPSPKKLSVYHGSLSGSTSSLQALAYPNSSSHGSTPRRTPSPGASSTTLVPSLKSQRSDVAAKLGDKSTVAGAFARTQKGLVAPAGAARPVVFDEEARRKQIRSWLRDVLSVQGAGHAEETQDFLQMGTMNEKDLKSRTKDDIAKRLAIDDALMTNRQQSARDAPHEIAELREEIAQLKRECIEGDGILRLIHSLHQHDTFSDLPLNYQQLISWMNLHLATILFETFLQGHDSQKNFERFQEFVQSVPWKDLSAALRGPTGLMVQRLSSSFADSFISKKILAVVLDDVPARKLEQEIGHLRDRLGSTVVRKIYDYVYSPAWQKAQINHAAQQADIPLVCAIVRGSHKPLLTKDGVRRVMSATRTYQEFIESQPSRTERKLKCKTSADVRLIYDMQRALQVISSQRNGLEIREGLDGELKPILETLMEPMLQLLKRLHRSKVLQWSDRDGRDVFASIHNFCLKLIDVLAGLRVRVQDPWRSLSTLVLLLDDAVPAWYRRLHHCSRTDPIIDDLAQWVQSLAHLLRPDSVSEKQDKLSMSWPLPSESSRNRSASVGSKLSFQGAATEPFASGTSERQALDALYDAVINKRTRQMETACRWAAGDADADLGIQLLGEGGKTRMTMYELPPVPRGPSSKITSALDRFKPGFRQALTQVFASL